MSLVKKALGYGTKKHYTLLILYSTKIYYYIDLLIIVNIFTIKIDTANVALYNITKHNIYTLTSLLESVALVPPGH